MIHYRVAYRGGWLVVKCQGSNRALAFAERQLGRAQGPFEVRRATERDIALATTNGACHAA